MNLTIDVGNTQIFCGIFDKNNLKLTFRKTSKAEFSSDELGIFFINVLKENKTRPDKIKNVCISSVVPNLNYAIKNSIIKYFKINPLFIETGLKTGINIKYKNPAEVGADRIANCVGANSLYGNNNYIIIDMGTATTFDILTANREYLGGLIIPGPKIQANSLYLSTAKLPSIEIKNMALKIDSTQSAIQSGIYLLNYYGICGIVEKIKKEIFQTNEVKVIGTGGFSRIYEKSGIFDICNYDLILYGLNKIIYKNRSDYDDRNA
jgi:type III pantothenate kinase